MLKTQIFQHFFSFSLSEKKEKDAKYQNSLKKFHSAFGCAQHPKVGQNTQQVCMREEERERLCKRGG